MPSKFRQFLQFMLFGYVLKYVGSTAQQPGADTEWVERAIPYRKGNGKCGLAVKLQMVSKNCHYKLILLKQGGFYGSFCSFVFAKFTIHLPK